MDIIANLDEKVNAYFEKWGSMKGKNQIIATKMMKIGLSKRALRMNECSTNIFYGVCKGCGNLEIIKSNLCRDRLCPTCQWRLSRQRFSEMLQVLDFISSEQFVPIFFTATVRNCKVLDLNATLKKMSVAWNRFLASRKIRPLFCGWAKAVEVTYNAKTREVHPHYHVIFLVNPEKMLDEGQMYTLLSSQWSNALKEDYTPITDLKIIKDYYSPEVEDEFDKLLSAIRETYKYTVKCSSMEDMPLSIFKEFVANISNIRLSSFGGIIKEARKKLGLKAESCDEVNDGSNARICTKCGKQLQLMVATWSLTNEQWSYVLKSSDDLI